ncbi:MAG: CDP-diacylglycerol--serine O-phosphatidyltransferase [Bdellovibrionales bacterium]|nr:CDP-diacylglycerol--serine O-phosphatidyltransferase [Bdellovibrionales bacterium]
MEADQIKPPSRPRLVRGKLQGKMFLIPSLITVLSNFCGFLAIISAVTGHFEYAVKAIAVAFVLDGLDGRVARRLNATSEFGREFDSLSDVVAFGVAPAVLVYMWGFQNIADEFGLVVSFSLVACGATRLARFNIDTAHRRHFVGLPIPAAAGAICSIIYMMPEQLGTAGVVYLMLLYTAVVAGLMVSTLPFFSVKHLKFTDGNPRLNIAVLAAAVALVWYQHKIVLLIILNGYAMSGLFFYFGAKVAPSAFSRFEPMFGLIQDDDEVAEA